MDDLSVDGGMHVDFNGDEPEQRRMSPIFVEILRRNAS